MALRIPPEVARHLGFYVYLYVDPRTEKIFYVGKGQGERILAHLSEKSESRKAKVLAELDRAGLEPRIEVLAHALADEETAFGIEAAVIDLLGLDDLTNLCRGWRSIQLGRLPLSELMIYYAAKPVEVEDPALVIRINQLYRHNMPAHDLYEATRGVWRLGERREGAQYALAVFEGVVREVYEIEEWHPAGSTPYWSRDQEELKIDGRWEFTGRPAPSSVRERYNGRSVASYFKKGQQSPVVYVSC
jgi:uncharacterized protein